MRLVAAALATVGLLAVGCSGSSGGSGASVGPIGASTIPSSAPAPTTSSATPTPSPSSTAPLSKFENDPAVKALRAWAAEAARTVNAGKYTSPALQALMTRNFAATMKNVLGSDVGLRYAGPIPFTPLSVRVVSPTRRDVKMCVVLTGYAVDPRTGKPAARTVGPADTSAVLANGKWLVSRFDTGSFSCRGVKIEEQ